MLASLSQLHLADYVLTEVGPEGSARVRHKSANAYRRALQTKYPEYKVICDCGNALKHWRLDRDKPSIKGAGAVIEWPTIVECEVAGEARYSLQKLVLVERLDGTRIDLGIALWHGIQMWSNELVAMSIIPRSPKLASNPYAHLIEDSAPSPIKGRMIGLVGERIEESLKFLRFDQNLRQLVDLDASKPTTVDLQIEATIENSPFE